MTTSRRFSRHTLAAFALAPGLLAGCASSGPFTAGRLPYGADGTELAARDPFLGRSGETQITGGDRPASQAAAAPGQIPAIAQTTWTRPPGEQDYETAPGPVGPSEATHQAAYVQPPSHPTAFEPRSDNPFAEVTTAAASGPTYGAAPAAFEAPAAPQEPNPFAEVQGQPPAAPASFAPAGATAVASGRAADPWQPRTTAATEEFLPPVR